MLDHIKTNLIPFKLIINQSLLFYNSDKITKIGLQCF